MKLSNITINSRGHSSVLKRVIMANLMIGKSNSEVARGLSTIANKPYEEFSKKVLGYIGSVKKELKEILASENPLQKLSKYFQVEGEEIQVEDYLFQEEGDPLPAEIGEEIYQHYNS